MRQIFGENRRHRRRFPGSVSWSPVKEFCSAPQSGMSDGCTEGCAPSSTSIRTFLLPEPFCLFPHLSPLVIYPFLHLSPLLFQFYLIIYFSASLLLFRGRCLYKSAEVSLCDLLFSVEAQINYTWTSPTLCYILIKSIAQSLTPVCSDIYFIFKLTWRKVKWYKYCSTVTPCLRGILQKLVHSWCLPWQWVIFDF